MPKLSLAAWALVPFLTLACASTPVPPPHAGPPVVSDPWYFAVSGDSRDCGDLIMPKIARAILDDRAAHSAFYWHLGDFRRMFGPDCDIIKRTHQDFDCKERPEEQLGEGQMNRYLDQAWDDFITHQVGPFGSLPVFLGIGNHELGAGRTQQELQRKFQKWLTSQPIHLQRLAEAKNHFYTTEGDTNYHFVQNGVDFIYLDNSDDRKNFTNDQLKWLEKVLANDAADPKVRTIVAGMHEALPHSTASNHAMDASCQGLCSGQRAYDLLEKAKLAGKQVYVFASHSHLFLADVFKTPEHQDHVLDGWIVGTAGAEQYTDTIQYGYALVAVHSNGTLDVSFREVTRTSPPSRHRPRRQAAHRVLLHGEQSTLRRQLGQRSLRLRRPASLTREGALSNLADGIPVTTLHLADGGLKLGSRVWS